MLHKTTKVPGSKVDWDELMKQQHRCFVLNSFAHFVLFMMGMAGLAWYAGYKDCYIGLFYLYRGPMFITLYFYFYSLNLVVGMRTLCWNNFGNNKMQKESGIMLE